MLFNTCLIEGAALSTKELCSPLIKQYCATSLIIKGFTVPLFYEALSRPLHYEITDGGAYLRKRDILLQSMEDYNSFLMKARLRNLSQRVCFVLLWE